MTLVTPHDEREFEEAEKLRAETARITQQTDFAKIMNVKSIDRADLTLRQFGAEVAIKETEAANVKKIHDLQEAMDINHHIFRFIGGVDYQSAVDCISRLGAWSRLDPGCDIQIIFTTPGGDTISGMMLYDYIGYLISQGHKVTTSGTGVVASMGSILLQAGQWRTLSPECSMLIHEGSFKVDGAAAAAFDTIEWIKKQQGRMLDIFHTRSAKADGVTATKKLSKAQLDTKWKRTEWWISPEEALAHGLIDEIV